MNFSVTVADDVAGISGRDGNPSRVKVDVEPAFPWSSFGYSPVAAELASGSRLNGTWEQETLLETGASPGTYQVSEIRAKDRAGNETIMGRAEIESAGWPVTFVNEP